MRQMRQHQFILFMFLLLGTTKQVKTSGSEATRWSCTGPSVGNAGGYRLRIFKYILLGMSVMKYFVFIIS